MAVQIKVEMTVFDIIARGPAAAQHSRADLCCLIDPERDIDSLELVKELIGSVFIRQAPDLSGIVPVGFPALFPGTGKRDDPFRFLFGGQAPLKCHARAAIGAEIRSGMIGGQNSSSALGTSENRRLIVILCRHKRLIGMFFHPAGGTAVVTEHFCGFDIIAHSCAAAWTVEHMHTSP